MWLANQTRPDISNAIRAKVRYAQLKSVQWGAALSFFKYLRTTSNHGTVYQRDSGLDLDVYGTKYANADYIMPVRQLIEGQCLVE